MLEPEANYVSGPHAVNMTIMLPFQRCHKNAKQSTHFLSFQVALPFMDVGIVKQVPRPRSAMIVSQTDQDALASCQNSRLLLLTPQGDHGPDHDKAARHTEPPIQSRLGAPLLQALEKMHPLT